MGTVKKKIDQQGRISIIGILGGTNIKPGDLVEVIPEKNKIILKVVKENKREGVIESIAGKWKNRPDIVADILNLRREEDRDVNKFPDCS
jgi:bifunctional DNA-binding transcriptional regulator/antitoxin component of YhaV-PrlF toxin-antitoxin module